VPARGRALLAAWGLFLAALLLLVAAQGLVLVLVAAWDLPVRMGYAVAADEALFGGATAAHHLQAALLEGRAGPLALALVALCDAVVLAALVVGMCVWRWRRAELASFQIAVLAVLAIGLVGQLLVPTVLPWLAAAEFEVTAPLRHLGFEARGGTPWRGALGGRALDAMPSMVAALSVLVALASVRYFGRRGAAAAVYAAVAIAASLYLGEQYLVTSLVGALVAVAVYLLVYRAAAARLAARPPWPTRTRALVATLLCVMALAALVAQAGRPGWLPSRAFAEAELSGRSPAADHWLGYHAHQDGDHAAAVAAFARLPPVRHDADTLRMFGVSLAAVGQLDDALAVLAAARERDPTDPRPLYLTARLGYQGGHLDEADVLAIVHMLFNRYGDDTSRALAEDLEDMLME
jgi:hypothetical protein